jgi:transcriptional regulator with AAA-type ATPase domain/tetratricopeptide (TPR) repeat protein
MPRMKVLADLVGDSPGIRSVRETVARLLARQQEVRRLPSILIQGETGTGKGLLARMIHRAGPRPDAPFIDVNCAAIPDTLLEAEMFGFERGAFTDARRSKPGLFQAAHRGTIFLDEVGLLPEGLQAKLLKVLEERTVRRLGATRDEPIDVWVVTATNEDLRAAIGTRRFREDLYHRLAVLTVTLPPLRERGGDILTLAEHFLMRVCTEYGVPGKSLAADARVALLRYVWPGNVRELSNVIERAVLMSASSEIGAEALALTDAPAAVPVEPAAVSLDDAMREHLIEVLTQTSWNISRTAALLGISRNTLRARMDKYGLREREGTPKAAPSRLAASPVRPSAPVTPISISPAIVPAEVPRPVSGRRWERRRLAVLRVALMPPGAHGSLETARALEIIVDKVRTFGGRIEGIGPIGIIAVFGLEAAGDATDRAAHAALAIVKAVDRSRREEGNDVSARIGVHAAPVLVGLSSGSADLDMDEGRDLWPLLDELIERAPRDGIVVTASAALLLTRRFELTAGPGLGGQTPTQVLIGREQTGLGLGGGLALFLGRQYEFDLLRSRLALVLAGHGQIVGIAGDAGIGKSRLIFELRQALGAHDVTYLEAHCHAHGPEMPYLPVLELVRAMCGISDFDTPEAMQAKVEVALNGLGLDASASSPYVLHLLGVKAGTAPIADLQPNTIKPRLLEILRQMVLRQNRRRPLVIVVDDLHWVDAASEEFLASLADVAGGAPLLLLTTYRPGYRPSWAERSYATQIALQPLLEEESRRLLQAALGDDRMESALEARILVKAEGNPFFLEELARVMRGRGADSEPPVIPDTIQELLQARIDRLSPEDRELLQTASVVGRNVSLDLLEMVTDEPVGVVAAGLARLRAAEFLVEGPGAPDGELTFRHALTHEATYATVSADRRRLVDARIVAVIERLHADRLEQHVDRLGHHAYRGELWESAVDYLRQGGRKAAGRSAHREASGCFDRALLALDRLPRTPELLDKAIDLRFDLRTSLTALAEYPRLGSVLREAEAIAEEIGDRGHLGRVSAYLSDYFRLMGDQPSAVAAGLRALDIARAIGDLALEVTVNTYLGLAYYTGGEYQRAIRFFEANLERVIGDLEPRTLGMAQLPAVHSRAWLAACLVDLGEFGEAAIHAHEANRIAEAAGHPLSRAVAAFAMGYGPLRQGVVSAALPMLERSFQLTLEWNFGLWLPTVGAALGVAYVLDHRVDEAVAVLEQAERCEAQMKRVGSHSARLSALAEGYLAAGQVEAAQTAAVKALELARAHRERGYEAVVLRILGQVHATTGLGESAADDYAAALGLAQSLGLRPLQAQCHLALGTLERQRGRETEGRRHLTEARSIFAILGMRPWLERADAEILALG